MLPLSQHPKNNCSKQLGANMNTLLLTYRTIVRTKIDYGSIVYNSASHQTLKKLDPLHHHAIRIAVGAFRISPIINILSEAMLLKSLARLRTLYS